jgi:hypothetical protein
MQPLALEAAALASGCSRKMGQKKEKQAYESVEKVGFFGTDFACRDYPLLCY